jgi:hypothetical protein
MKLHKSKPSPRTLRLELLELCIDELQVWLREVDFRQTLLAGLCGSIARLLTECRLLVGVDLCEQW